MSAPKPLSLSIKTLAELQVHYLPFLKRGGLFVATSRNELPGTSLAIELNLLDETSPRLVKGELAWRTPVGAQERKLPGIGVHFAESETQLKMYIEELLAGEKISDQPSLTL